MKPILVGGDLDNISFQALNPKLIGDHHSAVKFSSKKENDPFSQSFSKLPIGERSLVGRGNLVRGIAGENTGE